MHVRSKARVLGTDKKGAHILNIWYADESLNPSDQYTRRYDHSHRPHDSRRNNQAAHSWDNFIQEEVLSNNEKILYSSP